MKPRRRYAGDPDTTAVDFIQVCISTFREDLRILDALVARRRAAGNLRANRSAVIREAVRALAERTGEK